MKGASPNPGGRPKVAGEVRELARQHGAEAVETLVRLMRSAEKDETRARAAEALLDRGYGRPTQAITGDPENPIALLVEQAGGGLLERLRSLAAEVATPDATPALPEACNHAQLLAGPPPTGGVGASEAPAPQTRQEPAGAAIGAEATCSPPRPAAPRYESPAWAVKDPHRDRGPSGGRW